MRPTFPSSRRDARTALGRGVTSSEFVMTSLSSKRLRGCGTTYQCPPRSSGLGALLKVLTICRVYGSRRRWGSSKKRVARGKATSKSGPARCGRSSQKVIRLLPAPLIVCKRRTSAAAGRSWSRGGECIRGSRRSLFRPHRRRLTGLLSSGRIQGKLLLLPRRAADNETHNENGQDVREGRARGRDVRRYSPHP